MTREQFDADPSVYPISNKYGMAGTVKGIIAWAFRLHEQVEAVEIQPATPQLGDVTIILSVSGTPEEEAALVMAVAPVLIEETCSINEVFHVKARRDNADMIVQAYEARQ